MSFSLSQRSIDRMKGVKPNLIKVVERAIELTQYDFFVIQGLRTLAEQRENLKKGVSQTMKSKHLTGDAVDVGLLVDGKYDGNDCNKYAIIAEAFRKASIELSIPIRWGGCWNVLGTQHSAHEELTAYINKRRSEGRSPFLDLGHFELFYG